VPIVRCYGAGVRLPLVAKVPDRAARNRNAESGLIRFSGGFGPLNEDDARIAIAKPAKEEGVEINEDALRSIVKKTQGYPYFLRRSGASTHGTPRRSRRSRRPT
jgi:molybdopterin-biosynthesis enzyme MoeA-like protein